ncbi:unnamed protein product [Paramecium sonneborni]|uniref:Uncharacterized protein n=1 Tax=Paramecium sonneborni TaxID=65129 RepID=A0A8S1QNX2_9CILI|nr:unnamed protein product [Paramecium sonneborni]
MLLSIQNQLKIFKFPCWCHYQTLRIRILFQLSQYMNYCWQQKCQCFS